MIRRILLMIAVAIVAYGCAETPKPKFQFPMDTRIGIVNNLEDYMTHQNFSSLRIGNFSKQINVDWDMPAYFENELTRTLQRDSRYTVIPTKSLLPAGVEGQHSAIIDQITMTTEIGPQVADFLVALADKYDLDVIIVIKSFRGPSAFRLDKHPFNVQGYGLFTRVFLLSKKAYAYANTAVIVFKANPLTYIGSGTPNNKKSSLDDFDLSGDLKNIPQSKINKLQPIIQKYAGQAIADGLKDANLISTQ